jgi:hypothetical protein
VRLVLREYCRACPANCVVVCLSAAGTCRTPWADEVIMGDKSPKSKNKNKQQNDAAKGKKAAAAASKQAPSTQK